ncbi:MAG: hypothetical protein M3179_11825 [Actinomycetota bacterium]|nr:hypothetical protein [Actinomycetota bacterium]
MTLKLRVRDHSGAMVVSATGVADERVLLLMREAVARAALNADLVVLELDELTLVDVGRLRELLTSVNGAPRRASLRVVARRTSALALLVRWRIHHLVPVHRSVEDAIATQRMTRGRLH